MELHCNLKNLKSWFTPKILTNPLKVMKPTPPPPNVAILFLLGMFRTHIDALFWSKSQLKKNPVFVPCSQHITPTLDTIFIIGKVIILKCQVTTPLHCPCRSLLLPCLLFLHLHSLWGVKEDFENTPCPIYNRLGDNQYQHSMKCVTRHSTALEE